MKKVPTDSGVTDTSGQATHPFVPEGEGPFLTCILVHGGGFTKGDKHSFIKPLFEPLGFDWRLCVAIIGAMAAREVFVATLGQIFAATNPEDPSGALQTAVYTSGPQQGELLFTAPTVVALLVFFAYALSCMSTVATIRRETNSWKWPLVAWGYMFVLAWVGAVIARHITLWLTG